MDCVFLKSHWLNSQEFPAATYVNGNFKKFQKVIVVGLQGNHNVAHVTSNQAVCSMFDGRHTLVHGYLEVGRCNEQHEW